MTELSPTEVSTELMRKYRLLNNYQIEMGTRFFLGLSGVAATAGVEYHVETTFYNDCLVFTRESGQGYTMFAIHKSEALELGFYSGKRRYGFSYREGEDNFDLETLIYKFLTE